MTSPAEDDDAAEIFVDQKGHADEILVDLGTLVWGKVLYDIEPDASYLQGHMKQISHRSPPILWMNTRNRMYLPVRSVPRSISLQCFSKTNR